MGVEQSKTLTASETGSCNMPFTNKERWESLKRRVKEAAERESKRVRGITERAKAVERSEK